MSDAEEFRRTLGSKKLVALLCAVDREVAQSQDAHIADDPVLLERWDNGLLTVEEHDAILQHLAICHECSQFIGDMARAGVMQFGEARDPEPSTEHHLNSRPPEGAKRAAIDADHARPHRTGRWFAVTTAACALAAVIGVFVSRSRPESMDVRLADAEFGQLLHYLNQKDFAAIVVSGWSKSGEQRSIEPDEERDRDIRKLTAMIERAPENSGYRLNLGQRLVEAGLYEKAASQFKMVTERDPENMFARLGTGLAQFQGGYIDAAEETFAAISVDSPLSVSARVNRVLCLLALGRKPEARKVWNTVPSELRDERLRRVLAVNDAEDKK